MSSKVVQHVFKKYYSKLASGISSVPILACELYSTGLIVVDTKNKATKDPPNMVYELLNEIEKNIKNDTGVFHKFLGVLRYENVGLGSLADPMERDYQQMPKTPDAPKEQQAPLLTKSHEESADPNSTSTEVSGAHRDLSDLEHQLKPDTIKAGDPLLFPDPMLESVEKIGESEQVFPDLDLGTMKQVEGPITLLCSQFPKTNQRLGDLIAAVEKYNAENPESCDLVLEEKRELVEDYEVEYRTLKEREHCQDCELYKLEISQLKDQHERENQTRMDTVAMQRCHICNLEDSLKEVEEDYKSLDDKYRAKEQELMIYKEREKESDLTDKVLKHEVTEMKHAMKEIERELGKLKLDKKQRKEEMEQLKNVKICKEIVDSEDTDISGIVEKTRRLRSM